MEDKVLRLKWHHCGKIVWQPSAQYVGGKVDIEYLDNNMLSLPELMWYTRHFSYTSVEEVYYKPKKRWKVYLYRQ